MMADGKKGGERNVDILLPLFVTSNSSIFSLSLSLSSLPAKQRFTGDIGFCGREE